MNWVDSSRGRFCCCRCASILVSRLRICSKDLVSDFLTGVIIGPVLGGLLADPVASYPSVFGDNSLIGGKDGVWWLKHWPYALPNLMSAIFLFLSAAAVIFGMQEVSPLYYVTHFSC